MLVLYYSKLFWIYCGHIYFPKIFVLCFTVIIIN